jgi:hypothetical protein
VSEGSFFYRAGIIRGQTTKYATKYPEREIIGSSCVFEPSFFPFGKTTVHELFHYKPDDLASMIRFSEEVDWSPNPGGV